MNTSNKGVSNPASKEPPSAAETHNYYNAAVQLHNNEFRTLGERANTFLLTQSIFIAGLVLLLINLKKVPIAFDIIAMGIIVTGVMFCLLHIRAGRSGAIAAYGWRKYMLHLEKRYNYPDKPWRRFSEYTYKKDKPTNCCLKKLWRKYLSWLTKEGDFVKCLPLPSIWLFSPIMFLVVWTGSACIYGFIKNNEVPLWLFILFAVVMAFSLSLAGYLVHQSCKAWRYPDKS